jgi:hypothetical protein
MRSLSTCHIGGDVENRGLSGRWTVIEWGYFGGCCDGYRETSRFKGQENIIDSRGGALWSSTW